MIPGQQGEFVIKLQSGSLFSVSGFRGNDNLNYMCVQASAVEMYHIGLVPVPSTNPPLRLFGCVLPSHVQSTIYPTPPNLTVDQALGKKATNREMISIAVQVKSVPERKVKVMIARKFGIFRKIKSNFLYCRGSRCRLDYNWQHCGIIVHFPNTVGFVK